MNDQLNLNLNPKRNKKTSKGRADFHKLGQLLKTQIEEENKRKIHIYPHKSELDK